MKMRKIAFGILMILWATWRLVDVVSAQFIGGSTIVNTISSGLDTSIVVMYNNCDAKDDAEKAGGSATWAYDAGIVVETGAPITGTGSFDNANVGNADCSFTLSGNLDPNDGLLQFYFKPQEASAGRICYTEGADFFVQYLNTTDIRITYLGATEFPTVNFANDGSTTYHLAFVFNTDDTVDFYVNNSLVQTVSGTGTVDDLEMHFFSSDGNAWDAWIDQVQTCNDTTKVSEMYALRDETNIS